MLRTDTILLFRTDKILLLQTTEVRWFEAEEILLQFWRDEQKRIADVRDKAAELAGMGKRKKRRVTMSAKAKAAAGGDAKEGKAMCKRTHGTKTRRIKPSHLFVFFSNTPNLNSLPGTLTMFECEVTIDR